MQHFVDIFGENILQHFIVVFTKKDDLDEEGMDFDLLNFLSSVDPTSLLTLVNKYRDRVMKFDNTLESNMRAKQVQDLLSMVFDVEKQTGGGYRNEIYKKAKKNQWGENEKLRERKRYTSKKDKNNKEISFLAEKLCKSRFSTMKS